MSIFYPIGAAILFIAVAAYILKRERDFENGKNPLEVKIGNKYITPSHWFWRKVRENKAVVVGFIIVLPISLWAWLA